MRTHSVVCLLVLAFTGCATFEPPAHVYSFKDDGLRGAAIDLKCAEDQIEVSVLNRREVTGCPSTKLAVRGCGRETTYECDASQGWYRSAPIGSLEQ